MEIETIIRGVVLVGTRNLEELTSFLVRIYICVCVCVSEREREKGGGGGGLLINMQQS